MLQHDIVSFVNFKKYLTSKYDLASHIQRHSNLKNTSTLQLARILPLPHAQVRPVQSLSEFGEVKSEPDTTQCILYFLTLLGINIVGVAIRFYDELTS